jgi:hypothetical protein
MGEYCPPESGGQRDREAGSEMRKRAGGSKAASLQGCRFGTTPALRATPPDSGGVFLFPSISLATHDRG